MTFWNCKLGKFPNYRQVQMLGRPKKKINIDCNGCFICSMCWVLTVMVTMLKVSHKPYHGSSSQRSTWNNRPREILQLVSSEPRHKLRAMIPKPVLITSVLNWLFKKIPPIHLFQNLVNKSVRLTTEFIKILYVAYICI